MAMTVTGICKVCGIKTNFSIPAGRILPPKICSECRQQVKDQKELEYFKELDRLTLEDRIRKVEKWIYQQKEPTSFPVRY